jgi:predicted lipoprotein with Yx(FWY)xxD motif
MSRLPKLLLPAVTVAIALVTAACGSSGGDNPALASGTKPTSPTPPEATPAPDAGTRGAVVSVATSPLGKMLVDGSGRTLYLFEADTGNASTCYDACAQAWPPLLTTGAPTAGPGATAALLGTTTRKDGATEVTYGGHPLYQYVADTKAGDTNGEGLNQFGAKWYVLAPTGVKIDKD